jgi:hypothetical protein
MMLLSGQKLKQAAEEMMEHTESEVAGLRQSPEELLAERRKIRRLQVMLSLVMAAIAQDPTLSVEQASELVVGARRAALAMFPEKELTYDLIYKPRFQRLMQERYRLQ